MQVNHPTVIPAGDLAGRPARQAAVLHHDGDDIPRQGTGNRNGFAAPCWAGHAHGSDLARRRGGHPPFISCRQLTNSFEAFRDLIESDEFYAVRLFALRGGDGNAGGDCRVNGDDWEKGAQALRGYASTWPASGTSSASNMRCYKPWSNPRNKLKVYLLPGV
jgi:hypothetical protein